MKKFQFKTCYYNWCNKYPTNTVSKIKLCSEFDSMINSGKESLEWCYELIEEKNAGWILVILISGLYDKLNIQRPIVDNTKQREIKEILQTHKNHLKLII